MMIEIHNTSLGDTTVLKAEEGKILVKDNLKAFTVYLGNNCNADEWIEEEYVEESEEV